MTSHDLFLQPKLLRPPAELSLSQRVALTGLVVVVHFGGAALLWKLSPDVVAAVEPAAIMVDLISNEPQVQVTPPAPQPEKPQPVVKPQPQPTPPKPKVEQKVVASSKSEAVQEFKAPEPQPAPVVEPVEPVRPPVEAPAAPPAPAVAPAAPPGPVTTAPASQNGAAHSQPKLLPSSAVRYLVQPVLTYPRASRDLSEQGVVRLKVLVDEQGRPKDIDVVESSGYTRLDHSAVQAMRRARFQPHIEDGRARVVWVVAPLTFKLED